MLYKGRGKDPQKVESYRPVCLINTQGKLLEKVIYKRISTHLAQKGMPNESERVQEGQIDGHCYQ